MITQSDRIQAFQRHWNAINSSVSRKGISTRVVRTTEQIKETSMSTKTEFIKAMHCYTREALEQITSEQPEVSALAAEMVSTGEAVIKTEIEMPPNSPYIVRVLLVPKIEEGLAVELYTCPSSAAAVPTTRGVEDRFWFFGRLSHWQSKHCSH
ncbi:hypothetical protein [Nitrogeniibacter aestuarii]|uniref:hypothetical protein n=1 Tax=Nitrogeniibacter aestuarii TaxID=2815343 RepID=UPI001D10D322|nr:hypothetical protein [Nitrogeniibacter aestuarii]